MQVSINGQGFTVDEHPDQLEFWGWVRDNRWETHTFFIFDRFITPEMTYLDLGAWIGPTVLYASKLAKRSLAVEPDPVAFKILQSNISLNKLAVEAFEEAVTGHNGHIELGSGYLGASTTRANRAAGGGIGAWEEGHIFSTTCSTLPSFVEKHLISGPLFIKMDVEGAEEQIIQDLEFFQTHRPTLYISLHPFWWRNEEKVWEQLAKLSQIYKHTLFAPNCEPISLTAHPRELVFTDVL